VADATPTEGLDLAVVHHLLPAGGAPRVLAEVLALRPQHRVTVYTRMPEPAPEPHHVVMPKHVTTRRFPLPEATNPLARLRDLRALPQRGRELAAIVDAEKHDVVFVQASSLVQHHEVLPYLRTPSLNYAPEPLRAIHDRPPPFGPPPGPRERLVRAGLDPYERLRARIDKDDARGADRTVTHSHFTAGELLRVYGTRADVVTLGVDSATFVPPPADGPPRERYVLSVGALHPLKGHQFVIEALATVPAASRPPLVIVGDRGPLADPLRQHAAALDVQLELLAALPFGELLEHYRRAGVVAAAMFREPFGLTPLEAAASGAAVVAVDEGGLRETVRHDETGLLIPRDARAFGAALVRVLDDPALAARLGAEGRRGAERDWTWEHTAAGYDALLHELAARGPRER